MKINAYAKLNLTLDIKSRREDGYHILDSFMQTVSLCDKISVKKSDTLSVICDDDTISESENIVYKVAKIFFESQNIKGGALIKIKKHIPVSAGLGGGSSDAAAVLIALNKLYKTGLSVDELAKIALSVGADVPFLIYGGSARVGGIGEIIEPQNRLNGYYCIILKEGVKQSTAKMYSEIDKLYTASNNTEKFISSLKNGVFNPEYISNAFIPVSDCKASFDALVETSPLCVSLSGSGPSVFALYNDRKTAGVALKKLKKEGHKPVFAKFI